MEHVHYSVNEELRYTSFSCLVPAGAVYLSHGHVCPMPTLLMLLLAYRPLFVCIGSPLPHGRVHRKSARSTSAQWHPTAKQPT